MSHQYDAIVVGARCAGSPTAMLLARKGHNVLLLDRATFPSDTVSTHLIHPPGVNALERWGLLDRVVTTGCPPIHTYAVDMGPFVISGSPGTPESPLSYSPRRTVLDALLVNAAAEAGVEVRTDFIVEEIVRDGDRVVGIRGRRKGGQDVTERAQVVVGADGVHSLLARTLAPAEYNAKPPLEASYYAYWSGLPMNGRLEGYDRGNRVWAAWPTNDDLTLVIVGWPYAEFDANKGNFEAQYMAAFDRAPAFAERMQAARREERFIGAAVPNFFRQPFGPGWALVGDAGYTKDFITAQGISDAFRQAEICADALHESFSGVRPFEVAMRAYQTTRDERVLPTFEFACQFASFTPPPPEMQQLFAAMQGNQDAMDGFARVFAGVTSPAEFFSPENAGRILAASPVARSAL
jgi:2-polyprenyl-6-methoxyphenol hydroxylase-like FAD-dependent oxidoreductase